MTIETRPVEAPSTPAEKSVGDVLRHAALIIEERGWTQGSFTQGGFCAYGAVYAADPDNRRSYAGEVLRGYIAKTYNVGSPILWNDEPGRTAAEVTAALRAAADEADHD